MRALPVLAVMFVWLDAADALACGSTPAPYFTIASVTPSDGQDGVVRDGAIEFRLKAYESQQDGESELVVRVTRTRDGEQVRGQLDHTYRGEDIVTWSPRTALDAHERYSVELTTTSHPRADISEPTVSRTSFTTSDALAPELRLDGTIAVTLRVGTAPMHDCSQPHSNCDPCPVVGERAALYADVELPRVSGGFADFGYLSWLTLNDRLPRAFDGPGEGAVPDGALVDLLHFERLAEEQAATASIEIPREDAPYKACFAFNAWDAFGHATHAEPVCIAAAELEDTLAELDATEATSGGSGGCSALPIGRAHATWPGLMIAAILLGAARLLRARHGTLRVALIALGVSGLNACAADPEEDLYVCTLIGCSSGFSLSATIEAPLADLQMAQIELCRNGECACQIRLARIREVA